MIRHDLASELVTLPGSCTAAGYWSSLIYIGDTPANSDANGQTA